MGDTKWRSRAERAEVVYEERIRSIVEKDHFGKVVSIEVNTGDFEIVADRQVDNEAFMRLSARHERPFISSLRIGGGHLARHRGWRMRHLWADVKKAQSDAKVING